MKQVFDAITTAVKRTVQTASIIMNGGVPIVTNQPNDLELYQNAMFQFFGFASKPIAGCYHILTNSMGDPARGISANSFDPRFQPALSDGETQIFDSSGQSIYLKNGTTIIITSPLLEINCPTVNYGNETSVTLNGLNLFLPNLPRSPDGLQTNQIWRDPDNTLKII